MKTALLLLCCLVEWLSIDGCFNGGCFGGDDYDQEYIELSDGPDTECGKQVHKQTLVPQNRIIGGNVSHPHSWPWMVLLTIKEKRDGIEYICGATIIRVKGNPIKSDIVVTAAHCVASYYSFEDKIHKYPKKYIKVYPGIHNTAEATPDNALSASKIYVHRNFTEERQYSNKYHAHIGNDKNDIALIRLKTPIYFNDKAQPICRALPNEGTPVDKTCVVTGWGRYNHTQIYTSRVLRQLIAEVHQDDYCRNNRDGGWGTFFEQDKMICAGRPDLKKHSCKGDSGGPLQCLVNAQWVLYGILSFGIENCITPGMPDVFSRVSYYSRWINIHANRLSKV